MTPLAELPVPDFDPAEVRRITEAVLERPQFSEAQPSLLQLVIQRVLDWLSDVMAGLSGRPVLRDAVAIVAVGIVLGMVVLILAWLRRIRRDPAGRSASVDFAGRSAEDWLALAKEHERSRRWRDALRCHYRALVAELVARGLLDEVPGRTAREYLAALRADNPRAGEPFEVATAAFEAAWYSRHVVTGTDVQGLRQAADQVRDRTNLARVS